MNKRIRSSQESTGGAPNRYFSPSWQQRCEAIHTILSALREQEIARLTSMVHHEKERQASTPAGGSDQAQMQQELVMHVSLLWRSLGRLSVIWAALERLEQRCFGYCEECGEEISIERLNAVPMARDCVECQDRSENFHAAEVATTFTSFSLGHSSPPSHLVMLNNRCLLLHLVR
jgi:RNA polymerase-binding protein DksA